MEAGKQHRMRCLLKLLKFAHIRYYGESWYDLSGNKPYLLCCEILDGGLI